MSRREQIYSNFENTSSSEDLLIRACQHTEAIFRFNCFNVEDSHDPSVGLEYGELAIPGKMLKTEVFDPIIGACTLRTAIGPLRLF